MWDHKMVELMALLMAVLTVAVMAQLTAEKLASQKAAL
jgi:hypothetical protein